MRAQLKLPGQLEGRLWLHRTLPGAGAGRVRHTHEELEFNLVQRGEASYLVGERRHDLRPGTLIWLFPEDEHLLLDESDDFEAWIAVFRPSLVRWSCRTDEYLPLTHARPSGPITRMLGAEAAAQLERMCVSQVALEREADRYNAALTVVLTEGWSLFCAAAHDQGGAAVHPAVRRAVSLLHGKGACYSLDQLARESGLSPARLSRVFARQIGQSLSAYRNRVRLDRFMDIFGRGRGIDIMPAAMKAGFGSYPQFHRVFRRLTGQSPAQYKRALRERP
ncbi:MAG: helix-turn-helix transcriptional regulator [Phycisphaeraceae bacterium]|nr:helix-turn-helix transcriptional regulator [Phycisphaeraceae bacterium]